MSAIEYLNNQKFIDETIILLRDFVNRGGLIAQPPLPPSEILGNVSGKYSFILGETVEEGKIVAWNYDLLKNPHMLILGQSGSGKTFWMKGIIKQVQGLFDLDSIVIIDPAGDYKTFFAGYPNVEIFVVGENMVINPLIPPTRDFNLNSWSKIIANFLIPDVKATRMRRMLRSAINEAYKNFNTEKNRDNVPSLYDVYKILENRKEKENRRDESLENLLSLLKDDILTSPAFGTPKGASLPEIIKGGGKTFVLDVSCLESSDTRLSVMLFFFRSLVEYMFHRGEVGGKLTNLIISDEGWQIIKYNRDIMDRLMREGRKYGMGIWLLTQQSTELTAREDTGSLLAEFGTVLVLNLRDQKMVEYLARSFGWADWVVNDIPKLGRGLGYVTFSFNKPLFNDAILIKNTITLWQTEDEETITFLLPKIEEYLPPRPEIFYEE